MSGNRSGCSWIDEFYPSINDATSSWVFPWMKYLLCYAPSMQLLRTSVIFNYRWYEIFSLSPQTQLVLVFLSVKMFSFRKLFLREQRQKPLKEIILR